MQIVTRIFQINCHLERAKGITTKYLKEEQCGIPKARTEFQLLTSSLISEELCQDEKHEEKPRKPVQRSESQDAKEQSEKLKKKKNGNEAERERASAADLIRLTCHVCVEVCQKS